MRIQVAIRQLLEIEENLFCDDWSQALNLSDKDPFLDFQWLNIFLLLRLNVNNFAFSLGSLGDFKFFALDLK